MEELHSLDVCEDCHDYIEAELDALGHHYSEKEYEELVARLDDAMDSHDRSITDYYLQQGRTLMEIHYIYNQDEGAHFTWRSCDLCFNKLGGQRYSYSIMGRFDE